MTGFTHSHCLRSVCHSPSSASALRSNCKGTMNESRIEVSWVKLPKDWQRWRKAPRIESCGPLVSKGWGDEENNIEDWRGHPFERGAETKESTVWKSAGKLTQERVNDKTYQVLQKKLFLWEPEFTQPREHEPWPLQEQTSAFLFFSTGKDTNNLWVM